LCLSRVPSAQGRKCGGNGTGILGKLGGGPDLSRQTSVSFVRLKLKKKRGGATIAGGLSSEGGKEKMEEGRSRRVETEQKVIEVRKKDTPSPRKWGAPVAKMQTVWLGVGGG